MDNLRSETTKGKRERFEQGLYNGDLRFGYRKDEDGRPMPNGDAEGVRLAYQWRVDGKTGAEIAALLNAAGYRTYRLIENSRRKATPDVDPRLRRPSFQYQNGLLSDDDLLKMTAPAKDELADLDKQIAARMPEHVTQAGEQIITIRASWTMATKEQKRDMLHLMLNAVYVDTKERKIVGYETNSAIIYRENQSFAYGPLVRLSGNISGECHQR